MPGGGGGVVRGTDFQLLMLSPNLLKTKFPYAGWGGVRGTALQLLMLSPNLLKTKFLYAGGGGGGWSEGQTSNF